MKVEFSPKAEKQLAKLHRDQELVKRLIEAMEELEVNPLAGKPLEGEHSGCRSLRSGDWRVIYEVHAKEEVCLVIRIGKRDEVYK